MSPTFPIRPGTRRSGCLGSLTLGEPRGQLESRLEFVVFLLRLLWACGQRGAQRHVHSGPGLSGGLPGLAQALAGKVEPMGIVDEAIEHGFGISGISNEQMPLVHEELAGDDGGTMTVAILEDFQEVVTGTGVERLNPLVEDQHIYTAEPAQWARMATVAARDSEVIEYPRNMLIEHGAIVTAGPVAERRGEPALADAGRAADQQIGIAVDPAALHELGEQQAVEATRAAVAMSSTHACWRSFV